MNNRLLEILRGLNGSLSSKRVAGLYCVIVSATAIIVLSFVFPEFPDIDSLLSSVLFTGAGLLGLGILDSKVLKTTNQSQTPKTNQSEKQSSEK